MLVKLTPEQIAREWEAIKTAVVNSLPPIAAGAEDRTSNILNSLLIGQLHCWVGTNDANRIIAIIITSVVSDSASGIKSLLIYSMYSFANLTDRDWAEGFVTFKHFAKSIGCNRICAYTEVPKIINLFKRVGEAKYTFVSMGVDDENIS